MKLLFLENRRNLIQFLFIWSISIFGNTFLIFLLNNVHDFSKNITFLIFLFTILIYGTLIWIGIKITTKVQLNPFSGHSKIFKNVIIPGIIGGIGAAVIIYILNKLVLKLPDDDTFFLTQANIWVKFIYAFNVGFNEEIFLRLFMLSLFYFLLLKFSHKKAPSKLFLNLSIVITPLLPVIFLFLITDGHTVSRIVILNVIGGLIYGYLFAYRSFWAAAIAHFMVEFSLNYF